MPLQNATGLFPTGRNALPQFYSLAAMGSSLSRKISHFWNRNDRRLLLIGLDCAGKTTVLYNLRLHKTVPSIPTIGFNVETIRFQKFRLTIWDVGGQDSLRPYWRHHFTGTQGVIFVVDSADETRLELARAELNGILSDAQLQWILRLTGSMWKQQHACLLILLNKRDLAEALPVQQLTQALAFEDHCKSQNRKYHVQPATATTGQGLQEGIDWLCKNMIEL